jgi:hypothetical protein
MWDKKKFIKLICFIFLCAVLKLRASDASSSPLSQEIPQAPAYIGFPVSLTDETLKGLRETLENAGEKAAAHMAIGAQNVGQKAAKELGDATKVAAKELREAIQAGKFQVPVTHSIDISTSLIMRIIGGALVTKSIWNELFEEPKNDPAVKKSFLQENKNIIGGVLGTVLLFNKEIINLFMPSSS